VNAHREQHRRFVMDHVPSAAIAHIQAAEERSELSPLRGGAIAIVSDIVDQRRRNDAGRAALAIVGWRMAVAKDRRPTPDRDRIHMWI